MHGQNFQIFTPWGRGQGMGSILGKSAFFLSDFLPYLMSISPKVHIPPSSRPVIKKYTINFIVSFIKYYYLNSHTHMNTQKHLHTHTHTMLEKLTASFSKILCVRPRKRSRKKRSNFPSIRSDDPPRRCEN